MKLGTPSVLPSPSENLNEEAKFDEEAKKNDLVTETMQRSTTMAVANGQSSRNEKTLNILKDAHVTSMDSEHVGLTNSNRRNIFDNNDDPSFMKIQELRPLATITVETIKIQKDLEKKNEMDITDVAKNMDDQNNTYMQLMSNVEIEVDQSGSSDDSEVYSELDKKVTAAAPGPNKSSSYNSRRAKNFDDNESDDGNTGYIDSQAPQSSDLSYMDTKGQTFSIKPNIKMVNYKNMFQDLIKQSSVVTMYPIVTMIITYDSSRAVTVTKKDDEEYYVKMYDLESYELKFEEKISGNYIKLKEVEQNSAGNFYAIVFIDDGVFKMRTFGKETRDTWGIEASEVNFNEQLGIDNYTMPIDDFYDPFITCCFITDDLLFVNLHHNHTRTHYHFIWDIPNKKFHENLSVDNFYKIALDCSIKNFPYKSFYNEEKNQVYTFYRDGKSITINAEKPWEYRVEQIYDKDLGQMVLFGGKALIVRSSDKVLFFKQKFNLVLDKMEWTLYHQIKVRGFIYFIKGNIRIQVTTDELIYFYLIDHETLMPNLENVMFNYMQCSQMMFGSRVKYGITYKPNQKSFDVYRRKYTHDLQSQVNTESFEGSKAIELCSLGIFLVTKVDKVLLFNSKTFQECGQIPITLLKTETREPNEVLGIQKSQDETLIAIISGKNLVMNEQKQNQLFIMKVQKIKKEDKSNCFTLHKRILVKDMPHFKNVSMKYHFKMPKVPGQYDTILFAKKEEIFEMNFETEECTTMHQFETPLTQQPEFFTTTSNQMQFMVSSSEDAVWYCHEKNFEVDIDELIHIDSIKEIVHDPEENQFYLLANKRYGVLGFYLIRFEAKNPDNHKFLTKWRHNLEIGDANIFILTGQEANAGDQYKELVVSYKTIYINTYNIVLTDLSSFDDKSSNTLMSFQPFQLWESAISGLILSDSKDFVSFSKEGIKVLMLGSNDKKALMNNNGENLMVHALDQFSYMKVDPLNFLSFSWQDAKNKEIQIQQEFQTVYNGDTTNQYQSVYNIKVHEITLRELLILQSFYVCKTQSQIVRLVQIQPNPSFFYKSFLELDCSNMVTLLSFDSQSMDSLLDRKNEKFFDEKYPVIYKNKFKKKNGRGFYYTNAIDLALKNNQIRAVNCIIKYIIKYQNNYVSSFLFLKNLQILIQKDISIRGILESNVFNLTFDYDEWPGNHFNKNEELRPYNHSIFHLRYHYKTVFSEEEFGTEIFKNEGGIDTSKVYKIKYQLNLLPQIGEYISEEETELKTINEGESFMSLCRDTSELNIFMADSLQKLIQFKWEGYGRKPHFISFIMMVLYAFILILYTIFVYINPDPIVSNVMGKVLVISLIYPVTQNIVRAYKYGIKFYWSQTTNNIDLIFNIIGVLNFFLQQFYGPFHISCKILMIALVNIVLLKLFNIMKIFGFLTPIVVMLQNVIYDLRIFLFFFFMLTFMFSLITCVMGLGNRMVEGRFRNAYKDYDFKKPYDECGGTMPGIEYNQIGMQMGNFLSVLRVGIGDFAILDFVGFLNVTETIIFWITWYFVVLISAVIFLNLIVAEASQSYTNVTETLEQVIQQETAALISDSEMITFKQSKNTQRLPKYLIVRQIDQ